MEQIRCHDGNSPPGILGDHTDGSAFTNRRDALDEALAVSRRV